MFTMNISLVNIYTIKYVNKHYACIHTTHILLRKDIIQMSEMSAILSHPFYPVAISCLGYYMECIESIDEYRKAFIHLFRGNIASNENFVDLRLATTN